MVLALVCGPLLGAVVVLLGSDLRMTAGETAAVVALTAAGVGAGLAFVGRIGARLRRLADAAESMRIGDRDGDLPEKGSDEIARLARVLNEVLARARRANADLVKLVGEHMEALELQRSILDNAAEYAILSEEPGGRILTANRGAVRALGLAAPGDAVGRRFCDFLAPEDVQSGRNLEILRATDEGATWDGPLRCQRLDGQVFHARVRVSPRRDGTGKLSGRVILLRDVSREMEADRRYADLFHSLQEAVYVTTPGGKFIDANEALAELLGFGSVEELLREDASLLYEDETDRVAWLEEVERSGSIRDHEVTLPVRGGGTRLCIESTRAIKGADGRTEAYLGTLVDVTERRHLQEQVFRSQRLDSVGTLASGLAHDFNNILSAIVPNAELIENNERVDAAARERARTIRAAAERAGGITRKLLRFARQEYDARNVVDLNMVVQESARLLVPGFGEGLRFETVLAESAPSVLGDATSLQQVVVNLVLNARDAVGPQGKIRVSTHTVLVDREFCRGREGLRPGAHGVLTVADDGVGMTPAQMDRIFDPFYTTKAKGLGSGLGLSVVYAIVSGYRGYVGVESASGKGTRFDVYLPEAAREEHVGGQHTSVDFAEHGAVLVVDDEEIVRRTAGRMLSKLRWRVLTARDGSEGVETLRGRARAIDAVFLDQALPGGETHAATEAIRELDPRIPVVLMGARARRDEALATPGVAAFLGKPFDYHELSELMAALLRSPQGTARP